MKTSAKHFGSAAGP